MDGVRPHLARRFRHAENRMEQLGVTICARKAA
jgi:hypothetical protein